MIEYVTIEHDDSGETKEVEIIPVDHGPRQVHWPCGLDWCIAKDGYLYRGAKKLKWRLASGASSETQTDQEQGDTDDTSAGD